MHATLDRPRRLADAVPISVAQALIGIRSAIRQLERSRWSTGSARSVGDALIHLRSAEGKLDRLTGC